MSQSQLSEEDKAKIAANQAYINANREAILKEFAPTFCFHKNEDSFPMNADDYVKDVVMAKYRHFSTHKSKLTQHEKIELHLIESYFLNSDKTFNPNYEQEPKFDEFRKVLEEDGKKPRKDRTYDGFLTFDEKKYGYKMGSQVPIIGVHPKNAQGKKAPCYTAIIPTPDGFRVKYEYFYAISSTIPGTKNLYENLPYGMSKKANHFAIHAGDWEGVEINVKANPTKGTAELASMQTFAHGRDGARTVAAKDLILDENGRACVFVGQGTHPSYADNFVGRNKFMDVVGNKYKITPTEFVNLGPDAQKKELPTFVKAKFNREGDTHHMHSGYSGSHAINHEEYIEKSKEWNRYKPNLFFTKLYHKVKDSVLGLFGKKPHSAHPKSVDNFKTVTSTIPKAAEISKSRARSQSFSKEKPKAVTRERANSMPTKPGSWKERTQKAKAVVTTKEK